MTLESIPLPRRLVVQMLQEWVQWAQAGAPQDARFCPRRCLCANVGRWLAAKYPKAANDYAMGKVLELHSINVQNVLMDAYAQSGLDQVLPFGPQSGPANPQRLAWAAAYQDKEPLTRRDWRV